MSLDGVFELLYYAIRRKLLVVLYIVCLYCVSIVCINCLLRHVPRHWSCRGSGPIPMYFLCVSVVYVSVCVMCVMSVIIIITIMITMIVMITLFMYGVLRVLFAQSPCTGPAAARAHASRRLPRGGTY